VNHFLSRLQGKFTGEPAGRAVGANATVGQWMLEAKEPGAGSDGRSLHVAGDGGAGHERVDERNLGERERLVQGTNRDLLANVVGVLTEDCPPGDTNLLGRIFQFDAHFSAR